MPRRARQARSGGEVTDSNSLPGIPGIVLDTNVVLDWLVFRNPRAAALGQALAAGHVRWLSCAAMRAELVHMLASARLARWSPEAGAVLSAHDRLAVVHPPPAGLMADRPRCSDPDDQVFLDLALAQRARWLLTHDRALLRLGRRAARHALAILPPQRWTAAGGAGAPPA